MYNCTFSGSNVNALHLNLLKVRTTVDHFWTLNCSLIFCPIIKSHCGTVALFEVYHVADPDGPPLHCTIFQGRGEGAVKTNGPSVLTSRCWSWFWWSEHPKGMFNFNLFLKLLRPLSAPVLHSSCQQGQFIEVLDTGNFNSWIELNSCDSNCQGWLYG